jgi:hypothetical protein
MSDGVIAVDALPFDGQSVKGGTSLRCDWNE